MKKAGNKLEYVDVATGECPVSEITAESRYILELVTSSQTVKESGGVMFGTDSSLWPAWYFAAVQLNEEQTAKFKRVYHG